jgi:hypothetical protein
VKSESSEVSAIFVKLEVSPLLIRGLRGVHNVVQGYLFVQAIS